MTSVLLQLAGGRVVAVLEGGYVPEIVAECAAAVLRRLLGDATPPPAAGKLHKCTGGVLARVEAVMVRAAARLCTP
jgi:histone deacetylase 6